ncbi:trypsin-like [Paramisgurnus dabryanus]|uniref:trypsin-like n=1 Tax=Paramisgurnus dabryanus TaxID=90735 RepID=UPI003CCEFF6D
MRFNTVLCVAMVVLLNLAGSFCQLDVCGQTSLNTKIIGGENANAGSWPWQVMIKFTSSEVIYTCGGSLINKDWVLAGAQSFNGFNNISDIVIYLGSQNLKGPNLHEINRTVIQLIKHPDFDPKSFDNDIALLQLSSSVNFTDYIKPVCLAAAGSEFGEGLSSWLTGWGYTSDNSPLPDILQEVEVPFVSNYNCSIFYNGTLNITDNMLCAGLINVGGKGPCSGDSGGPLISKQHSRWIQAGIVSVAISSTFCVDPMFPTVFTRVSKYQDWINAAIVTNQPGFVKFPDYNYYTPDYRPTTPDCPYPLFPDIFSGSSSSLYFLPSLSLTFSIISLIVCLFL